MPPNRSQNRLERTVPGERLRSFRDWLSLTHADVASILGFAESTVQQYESAGAPEWVRLALLGWAVVVHGSTPRAAARHLGLPWEHFAPVSGTPPDAAEVAQTCGAGEGDADESLDEDDDVNSGDEVLDGERAGVGATADAAGGAITPNGHGATPAAGMHSGEDRNA